MAGIDEYNKKRSFDDTPEPEGTVARGKGELVFVIQKHDASHLHYDFRLEWEGVLKSWSVPKGPSLDPSVKRLAVEVEDHPKSYGSFEGEIPEGNYGAGDVIVWDRGTYRAENATSLKESMALLAEQYAKGELKIELFGEKLKGSFALVRTKRAAKKPLWLLIKHRDAQATTDDVTAYVGSVLSERVLPRDAGAATPKKRPATASRSPMPHGVSPMLATLVDAPFSREGWLFERKFDGYRAIAEVEKGRVTLTSRNGKDFTQFDDVKAALTKLAHDAVLDGEVVAERGGKESFQALQQVREERADLRYDVFDLLWLDGVDLRAVPLVKRKALLKDLLDTLGSDVVRYSEHVERDGVKEFARAVKRGDEGIMAKRADSPYASGRRTDDWLKIKTRRRQEGVIGGFTAPRGSRKLFGALLLGVYENGAFTYVGHVGSGFGDANLQAIHAKLAKLKRKTPSFSVPPKPNAPVTWVSPKLVAEVQFQEWTDDKVMRQATFVGLRDDKDAKDVVRETERAAPARKKSAATPASTPGFTNVDKILFPELKLTKGDVIAYYRAVSTVMLPYLKDRPENLLRHPNGIQAKGFFQKNFEKDAVPDFARTVTIHSDSAKRDLNYLVCDNEETLLWMAQLGSIEINPWNARVQSLEHPDYVVFDLDPGENRFEDVVAVAQQVRATLEDACMQSFCKTSGKTGLHIVVPLGAQYTHEAAKEFAELIMTIVHRRMPDITSIERSPAKRKKLIYLDYLQNRYGQTVAAPYSLRPVLEASVSTPLLWSEVTKKLDLQKFTSRNILARIDKKGDLWAGTLKHPEDLKKALICLKKNIDK